MGDTLGKASSGAGRRPAAGARARSARGAAEAPGNGSSEAPRRRRTTRRAAAAPRSAGSERGRAVAERLAELHPASRCSLDFRSPLELLLATILSAQCTDRRVNLVTPELFRRWPTAAALAAARPRDLEAVVRTTGFFRAKAKNILGCARALVERHGGEVPESLAELVRLPGVGRKTANVVLGVAFGRAEGVVVDTHVGRISRRLGLTRRADAVGAERDLVRAIPRDHWIAFSHRLIDHGRQVCLARRPRCEGCGLVDLCPRVGVPKKPAAASRPAPAGRAAHGTVRRRRVQSPPPRPQSGRTPHGSPP
jgi:endonuclease-3